MDNILIPIASARVVFAATIGYFVLIIIFFWRFKNTDFPETYLSVAKGLVYFIFTLVAYLSDYNPKTKVLSFSLKKEYVTWSQMVFVVLGGLETITNGILPLLPGKRNKLANSVRIKV